MTTTFTLRQLQDELTPWVAHNFGDQPSWQPMFGIIEELGELGEACDRYKEVAKQLTYRNYATLGPDLDDIKVDIRDAIADVVVYMANFCGKVDFDLQTIVDAPIIPSMTANMTSMMGFLSHSYLKMKQGIRGSQEEHECVLKALLNELFRRLIEIADTYLSEEEAADIVVSIVAPVWAKVKQRDWKKNPISGDKLPNTAIVTSAATASCTES
jgi:NTP pyrophosphatase (non-canonical NTP hydrolase)